MAKKLLLKFLVVVFLFFLYFLGAKTQKAYATVTVLTATGGGAISADTTGGSYTTLGGILPNHNLTITEGSNQDVGTGTIVISAPTGFIFNTSAAVTAAITRDNGSNSCFSFSSNSATPTTTTVTFTVSSVDSNAKGAKTTCHVVFSGMQVRPSAGTPLASGNLTDTGTASINGMNSSTSLSLLTEVVGAKNKLTITTQPSSTVVVSTDFPTKPVIALEDQFGNVETGDSASTITEAVVLSTQSCGGTSGTGTLTSTPNSGSAVNSGVMTYTAMQYSASENIKICFSSSGVTSALSNSITVGVVSITITTSGVVSYGIVAVNSSKNTTASDLNDTQTVQNNGTLAEDFNIKGQNTACPWTLASSNGSEQYVHAFSLNSGSSWTSLATSYAPFATNIAVSSTQSFDLKLTTPTSTSCFSQQSVGVTIQAVAH